MTEGRRGSGKGARNYWAWVLAAAALGVMTVGCFLPSYGDSINTGSASPAERDGTWLSSYPGWECAWTVTWIWGNVIENGFGDLDYGESLMLSYLPINVLFLLGPVLLWLSGRTRRLAWVVRAIYTLIVAQVLAWWVLNVVTPDGGMILIGYWFWLAAFVLLAAAFWVMPRSAAMRAGD